MRRIFLFLFLLSSASSVYGVGEFYALSYGDQANAFANARGLTVGSDGTVYVAGATKDSTAAQVASYWTLSGGVLSAPVILPGNSAGVRASQAVGIGVLGDNTVVVAGNLIPSGTVGLSSDWTSASGQADNGWKARTGISVGGTANQVTVQSGGNRWWSLGKNSNGTIGYRFDVDGTARTETSINWSLRVGFTTGSFTNTAVQGVSSSGLAVGELRNPNSTTRRAFVSSSGTATILPGIPGRTDGNGQGYGISEDGKTACGLGYYADGDTVQGAVYWTESGGTWTAHKLSRVPAASSSAVGYAVNQNGSIIVGRDNITGRGEVAAFWDVNQLGNDGLPRVFVLKDWLSARGVDMSGWTELTRIYSVTSANGVTYVSGEGIVVGGTVPNAGFLAVIPEPATMLLAALGGLVLLRRR